MEQTALPGDPAPDLEAPRLAAPFALAQPESACGRAPPLHTHTPQTPRSRSTPLCLPVSGRKSSDPPSLRRQLPAAGEGGELSLGVRSRGCRGRPESWRGRTVTTPSVQQKHGRRVRAPVRPRPLAWLPSSDPATQGSRARPFGLPLVPHTHLAGPARVPALAGGARSGVCVPGTASAGAGAARRTGTASRGSRPGTEGGGERHRLAPPLAPPSSPPLSGGGCNEFQMWRVCPAARAGDGGGGARGPFVRISPHPPPRPAPPGTQS